MNHHFQQNRDREYLRMDVYISIIHTYADVLTMTHPGMFFLLMFLLLFVPVQCYFRPTLIYCFLATPLVRTEPIRFHREDK